LKRVIISDWKNHKIGIRRTLKRNARSKHAAKILNASSSDLGSIIAFSYLIQATILIILTNDEKTAKMPNASGVK
jgi:hypothetical protein